MKVSDRGLLRIRCLHLLKFLHYGRGHHNSADVVGEFGDLLCHCRLRLLHGDRPHHLALSRG